MTINQRELEAENPLAFPGLTAEQFERLRSYGTPEEVEPGVEQLRADLDSGAWAERHADLLERDELDLGYRLLVA